MKIYDFALALSLTVGIAGAASIEQSEYSDSLNDNLRLSWDFNTGNTPSYIGTGTASAVSSNWNDLMIATDGYGVVSGNANAMYHTAGLTGNAQSPGRFDSSAFTISLDIKALTLGTQGGSTIFNVNNWNNTNNGGSPIILKKNDQNGLTLTLDGNTIINTTESISNEDWTTITLTSAKLNVADTNQTLTLYINGEQVGSATGWIASQNIDAIQFGSVLGQGSQAVGHMEVDNISLWNRALSSSEVKSLQVPEPTTASLSLLALSALALRRRRK